MHASMPLHRLAQIIHLVGLPTISIAEVSEWRSSMGEAGCLYIYGKAFQRYGRNKRPTVFKTGYASNAAPSSYY
jgi:hypothetical protein